MIENLLVVADRIGRKAHEGQFRKWSNPPVPYFEHCLRCKNKIMTLKDVTEVDGAVMLLHDTVEDCGEQWKEIIRNECGPMVLEGVLWLTFETEGAEWAGKPRAEKNRVRFEHMRKTPPRWQRAKMVDRWDNLNDMVNAPHKLIAKTVDESWVLHEICGPADAEMAEELAQAIRKLEKRR